MSHCARAVYEEVLVRFILGFLCAETKYAVEQRCEMLAHQSLYVLCGVLVCWWGES